MEESQKNPFAARRAEIQKTQRQIANEIGVTGLTVNRWEMGRALPGAVYYDRLAAAYLRDRAWVVEVVMQLAQPTTSTSAA